MYYLILQFTLVRPKDNSYKRIDKFLTDKGYERTAINTSYRIGKYNIDEARDYFFPNKENDCSEEEVFEKHKASERQAFERFMAMEGVKYKLEIYAISE